ncbi:ABC transporter permease [Hufsiella ginkgonis]|uniref:FtsX-like permease family protein n=1 Tax=Hufsiella ginkgonis TaxID=2695274 RepID=A0A7K1XSQ0_9SPHI|nr:ABC transporter permease [Hufsiella ginkgonis]MXV13984.1 FtsX-like permease family protein [Hufsiella ginkgonis]
MISTNLKLAYRNFLNHKLFTFINMVGLAIGMSAALVIYLIVHFDFSFDDYHPGRERVYRVVSNYVFSGEPSYNGGVTAALADAAKKEVTGLELVVPFHLYGYESKISVIGENKKPVVFKKQDNFVIAGKDYFNLLKYEWLAGSPAALDKPDQVVLTAERVQLYFPHLTPARAIGREVTYEDTLRLTVAGVVATPVKSSDFQMHDFISYPTIDAHSGIKGSLGLGAWTNTNSSSQLFVRLKPGTSPAAVTRQLNALLQKNKPKSDHDKSVTQAFMLQPLADIHFNSRYASFEERTANKSTLYGLLGIAAFLLVLGCINFINLTTAQAGQRAKEIGIRKTMGSRRIQLMAQFLSETLLLTLMATLLAIAITPLVIRLFKDFIPNGITAGLVAQPAVLLFLAGLTLLVSMLSGFYPGLVLSGFKPISVLKNNVGVSGNSRKSWLRKSLTVTQFVIAQFFIMLTLLVSKQIYYILHKDLGFKKDAIVYFDTPWKEWNKPDKKQVLLNTLRNNPLIERVSMGGAPPSSVGQSSSQFVYLDGKKEVSTDVQIKKGDENYTKIYQVRLLAGKFLGAADSTDKVLINATYAHVLGFRDVTKAVGKSLKYNDRQNLVVGVFADFHQKSLHTEIKPLVILYDKQYAGTFHLALKPETAGSDNWKRVISETEKTFKTLYPEADFEYNFVDDSIAKFYKSEQDTSTLLKWATGLSIFISCMGLLGLAVYTTSLRAKEIGVRKVLGASVRQIVALLSKELTLLVILASVLVTPVAWYAMNRWLQDFTERTSVNWWIFFAASGGMLCIALIVSGIETVRAAVANPVKSLRTE